MLRIRGKTRFGPPNRFPLKVMNFPADKCSWVESADGGIEYTFFWPGGFNLAPGGIEPEFVEIGNPVMGRLDHNGVFIKIK